MPYHRMCNTIAQDALAMKALTTMRGRTRRLLTLCLIASLCTAAAAPSSWAAPPAPVGATTSSELNELKAQQARSIALADKLVAATVGVMPDQGPDGSGMMGMGSGVIVSKDGLILTAAHVTRATGKHVTVLLSDGRKVKAESLGSVNNSDASMMRITDKGEYPYVELGNSTSLKVGDWCLAVGHAGGFQVDRTAPIRLGRVLHNGDGATMVTGIRTDAAMISGDSGGPLFDMNGRVIGIHSNIGPNTSINHHVPVDVFKAHWDEMLAGKMIGKVPAEAMGPGVHGGLPKDLEGKLPGGAFAKLQKFQEMLQQRLAAHDPELMKMAAESGGRLQIDEAKMAELVDRWEKEDAAKDKPADAKEGDDAAPPKPSKPSKDNDAAATPAKKVEVGPGDDIKEKLQGAVPDDLAAKIAKFQKMLMRRVAAQDPEVMKLVQESGGQLQVDATKMAELVERWEKEDAAKGVDPDANDDELGALDFGAPSEAEREALQKPFVAIEALTKREASSTVSIDCDGEPAVLGAIVDKRGYIVTKASELHGKLTVHVGDDTYDGTLVTQRKDEDLALVKIDAKNLTPVRFANVDPVRGTWVACPDPQGNPMAAGIVSVNTREIPRTPQGLMANHNKAALGIGLGRGDGASVGTVFKGSAAEKAGLKAGDVITAVDGQETPTIQTLVASLSKFEPGDEVTVDYKRDGNAAQTTVKLESINKLPTHENPMVAALSGGKDALSKRRTTFPAAFTHDSVLTARQCGGPVVDLDGRVVAINIARVDRTASYAVPASHLLPILRKMIPQ
ncbi:MAG: PDZ domain-containing protein [Phycisphaera sp.]|nr:PDZ domain-containing protein [Phycisphaera sp.]